MVVDNKSGSIATLVVSERHGMSHQRNVTPKDIRKTLSRKREYDNEFTVLKM